MIIEITNHKSYSEIVYSKDGEDVSLTTTNASATETDAERLAEAFNIPDRF